MQGIHFLKIPTQYMGTEEKNRLIELTFKRVLVIFSTKIDLLSPLKNSILI